MSSAQWRGSQNVLLFLRVYQKCSINNVLHKNILHFTTRQKQENSFLRNPQSSLGLGYVQTLLDVVPIVS